MEHVGAYIVSRPSGVCGLGLCCTASRSRHPQGSVQDGAALSRVAARCKLDLAEMQ